MKNAKKILLVFSIFAITGPLLLPAFLQLNILFVKMEAKEKLKDGVLQTIRLSKANFSLTGQPNEILIGNRLFDIKEYTFSGDHIIVTGLFDDQETLLEKQIRKTCEHQKSKTANQLRGYFQFINSIYFQQTTQLPQYSITVCTKYLQEITSFKSDYFIKVPSPPPQA